MHSRRSERDRCCTVRDDCRRSRRLLWRRTRARLGLRYYRRRQNGAVCVPRAASGTHPRLRRHPAVETRSWQRFPKGFALHWANGQGDALRIARSAAAQITKFDAVTRAAAKKFIKPIPHDELRCEIDLFCELFTRPAVMAALKKFVEDSSPMPYLP